MLKFKDVKEISTMEVIDDKKYTKKITEAFLKMKIKDLFESYNERRRLSNMELYKYDLFIFSNHVHNVKYIDQIEAAFSEITVFEFLMLTRRYYADKSVLSGYNQPGSKELAYFHIFHMIVTGGYGNALAELFFSISLSSFYRYLNSLKDNPLMKAEWESFYESLREIPEFKNGRFCEVSIGKVLKLLLEKMKSNWYPWQDIDDYKNNMLHYYKLCERLVFDSFYYAMKHRYCNKSCSIKLYEGFKTAEPTTF